MAQTHLPEVLVCSTRLIREGREERWEAIDPRGAAMGRAREMREFKSGLAALVGDPCVASRPFVCDGAPLDCRVMLVGINPATVTPGNFWDYWDDDAGFNRRKWRESQRTAGVVDTRSRKVIELIVAAARPVSCLEANLYPFRSARRDGLRGRKNDTAALEFMLEKIERARLIVVFGGKRAERMKVVRIAQGPYDERVPEPKPFSAFGGGEVYNCGDDVHALLVRHYIYWSHDHARAFGEWLREKGDV